MGTGLRGGDLRRLRAKRARKLRREPQSRQQRRETGWGGAQGSLPETQRRAKHRLSAAFRNPGGVSAVQTMLKGSCPVRSGTGAPSSFPPQHLSLTPRGCSAGGAEGFQRGD